MSVVVLSSGIAQFPVLAKKPSLHLGTSRKQLSICSSYRSPAGDGFSFEVVPKLLLVPLAAFAVAAAMPGSARAGFFDLELPGIPVPDSAIQSAEKQRQKYQEFDENVKKSPFVQELLKRSKEKAAKNKQDILDKYCQRQAEWGVGDCALPLSTPDEKKQFFDSLKKKRTDAETGSTASTEPGSTVDTDLSLPSTEPVD